MDETTTGLEDGRPRRRRWSLEEKRAAVELSLEGGVAEVAKCLGITANQIYAWRRELREMEAGGADAGAAFLPVTVDPVPVEIERDCCSGSVMDAGRVAVAIDLQGISVLVAHGADPTLVASTISALRGMR